MKSVRNRSFRPEISGLEGRQLLSAAAGSVARHAHAAAQIAPMTAAPGAMTLQVTSLGGTINPSDFESNGLVIKTPKFYEDYRGPKLGQLNAKAAEGLFNAKLGEFGFAGENAGLINPKVRATYVWGIDRSGRLPTGPFPNRPNIRFDAVVVVKLVPGHKPTVTVSDLATKKTTTLQNFSLRIANKSSSQGQVSTIELIIPASVLPSTGLTPAHYRYAYWPEDGLPGSTNIASFAPETHDIQVGVPRS
jgi:hypothetical protein